MNATAKPTTYPPVFALIPKELTACSNWVMWKYEQRDDRWTKVPYTPAGALASSTEPATWSAFDVAKAAYRPEVFDGVGFMLGGSGFVGIDLDHVLDDVHLDDEAGRIIDAINSYTEVSPSTQGIRIIARGTLPDGWRSTKKYKVAIEMYDTARYLTITGRHIMETPKSVEDRGAEIAALHAHVAEAIGRRAVQPVAATPSEHTTSGLTDEDVLVRAQAAKNGAKFRALWNGDTNGHHDDDSAADLALCDYLAFWTGKDAEQMDRLFRQSKLMRDKWDSRRNGETYGAMTIRKAITDREEVYTPRSENGLNDTKRLVLTRFADIPMEPIPWLWPGYLVRGAVTLLVGDPDLGKSLTSTDLAARISAGRPWPDEAPGIGRGRDVVILAAEDSAKYTSKPRLAAAGADMSHVALLRAERDHESISLKTDVALIESTMAQLGDPTLLIVDPLSAYLPGVDTFKDNEVRATLAPFVAMAGRTGIAVLAIIHLNKNVERNALQRVLGSVAFTALSRATFAVVKDPEDSNQRLFLCAKMNIAPRPAGFAFTVVGTRLDPGISTAKVKWSPVRVTMTPDEALRRAANPRAGDDAAGIFRTTLANGPVLAKTMEALCAEKDIASSTADRTKKRLGIKSVQTPAGWYWTPPGWSDDQIKELCGTEAE